MPKNNRPARQMSAEVAQAPLKESTIRAYQLLYQRQIKQATIAMMDGPEDIVQVKPAEVVDYWIRQMSKARYTTSSLNRAALLWYLENEQPEGWECAHSNLKAIIPKKSDFQVDENSEEVNFRRTRPPGRMIPEAHLHILLNELLDYRKTGAQAQWFLMAGIASGARPVEWIKAKWIDEPNGVLRIYTAKIKTRNAWDNIPAMTFTAEDLDHEMDELSIEPTSMNGEKSWHAIDFSRRISSIPLTPEELAELNSARYYNGISFFRDVQIEERHRMHVKLHMQSVRECIESRQAAQAHLPEHKQLSPELIFGKYYFGKIRHCLWRACTTAFNGQEMYSLADTRSTFSANRKGQAGLVQTAKDMGHEGRFSARDYYAPASKAWAMYKPVHGNTKSHAQAHGDVQTAVPGGAAPAPASIAAATASNSALNF